MNIEDVLEDVLSEVLCDLLGYWAALDSSQSGDQLSFAYAVTRGTWMGVKKVTTTFRLNAQEELFNPQMPQFLDKSGSMHEAQTDATGISDDFTGYMEGAYTHFADPDPLPDEQVVEMDEQERARAVLESLGSAELHDYFANLLNDESQDVQAERQGISRRSVRDRREVRTKRLKQAARRFGLEA